MPVITIYRNSVTVDTNNYTIIDSRSQRIVQARFQGLPRPLTLWSGDEYDSAGDYTQSQADSRVAELLGNSPETVLQSLASQFQVQ